MWVSSEFARMCRFDREAAKRFVRDENLSGVDVTDKAVLFTGSDGVTIPVPPKEPSIKEIHSARKRIEAFETPMETPFDVAQALGALS